MSWLKKVFGRLKDEHIDSEEPSYTEESNIAKPKEKNKEIEARVSYQYPKGEFRFPIIPDSRESHKEDRTSRSEQRRQRREQPKYEESTEEQPDKSPEPKKKKEKPPASDEAFKRPFRPTEIPSPIYGFRKPAQKDPVHYELKSAEKRNWRDAGETTEQHSPAAQTGTESGSIKESYEELSAVKNDSLEPVQPEDEGRLASSVEETPSAQVHDQITSKDDFESAFTYEQAPLAAPSEAKPEEENQEIIEVESVVDVDNTQSVSSVEDKVVEESTVTFPANSLEENNDEGSPIDEEQNQAPHNSQKRSHLPFNVLMLKQDKRRMERMRSFTEDEQTQEESAHIDPAVTPEEKEIVEHSIVQANIEETAVVEESGQEKDDQPAFQPAEPTDYELEAAEESTESLETDIDAEEQTEEEKSETEQAPTRSHLPFNVLMLKQDKRKMDSKLSQIRPADVAPAKEAQGKRTDDSSLKNHEVLTDHSKLDEGYSFPQMNYLSPPVLKESSGEWLEAQRNLLNDTLANFNVRASVVKVTEGPSVTRFEVQPEPGVKVNKITNLADDIKLSLAARDIRIEAPIPGKHTIGIEVPNKESRPVALSEIISSGPFQDSSSPLTAALGLDISGEPIVTDLNKMPHGLIAGATGSGKSVCINSILVSLLYKASPQDLKLLLIDPKMVELAPYNRMPHLVSPVITDVKAATAALKWAVEEMERRYELFAHTGVRDIGRYNLKAERNGEKNQKLPYLVIVIDELADLMMMSPADVEEAICRIAQKARACGIHLIIATQRPSVDVITGLIKANVPTRIAFSVSSGVDSRTIIDSSGAEKLLGKGDMLFLENGSSKPVRLQGTFVSDDEIDDIVSHVRGQGEPVYLFEQDELLKKAHVDEQEDELFVEACEFVIEQGGASTSLIQRHFRVGYNRAARLIDLMESHGFVSEAKGSKPRDVLISSRELEELQDTSTII